MEELGDEIARRRGIPMTVAAEADRRRALDGRRLRDHRVLGRRLRQHAARHRDPAALRHPPADRRQRRPGRDPARAAQRAGAARHRARRRSGRARRVVRQRHEPAHRAVPVGHARDGREDGRALQRVGRLHVDPEPAARLRHAELDPVLGGVNHFPLATVAARRRRRRRLRAAARAAGRSRARRDRADLDGSARAGGVDEGLARRPLDEARRDREQPGAASSSSAGSVCSPARAIITRSSSCPASCTPATTTARDWRVHHYGMAGHRRDADDDVEYYEEVRDAPDVTRMPSGELVAHAARRHGHRQARAPAR